MTETTQQIDADGVVHASAPGHLTTPTLTENTLRLGGQAVPVRSIRTGATALALLTGAFAALGVARARRAPNADLESVRGRLVTASNIDLATRPVIDLDDTASLARLAERYDTAVIHIPRPDGDLYHVIVDDTLYRYARPARPAGSDDKTSSHVAVR